MVSNVFVYGSLLADEVVHGLLEHVPKHRPATVQGYARFGIKQRIYPAVIKATAEQSVQGRVFFDLSAKELDILDEFEDEDYSRQVVTAVLENGESVQAAMYVWQDAQRGLLQGTWDYEVFRRKDLQNFLGMMVEWERSGDFPEEVA